MKDYVLIITIHADPAMPPGYDEWGGTHTYMRELLDEMDAARVNCVLITRRALQELPAVEQYRPHCVIYLSLIHICGRADVLSYHQKRVPLVFGVQVHPG